VSPSPVTFASPTAPASYSWEATDEGVAERYGLPLDAIVRFDLNTSPAPPRLLGEMLAAGTFETSLSEYPPGDYRHLVEAAAARYGVGADEVVPGAGADEILDMCVKAFLPPGGSAVVPVPSYAMYRVVIEQRGGRMVPVPRLGPDRGWSIDVPAVRAAARAADMVWLCNPNNPTGSEEPPGTIERLLDGLASDGREDGRGAPPVVIDEAYAEFAGHSSIGLRTRYPALAIVRTASKAYALAGLRVGFAVAAPPTLARIALFRPPGSVGTISETIVTRALRDVEEMRENVARVQRERARLTAGLAAAGWAPYPSVTNFVLADLGTPERAGATAEALMRRGLVPRTFPAGHPLAQCLRVTVRSPEQNDRIVAAAREIAAILDGSGPRPGNAEPIASDADLTASAAEPEARA
jgi:histidinol-phosphate aminotransferase